MAILWNVIVFEDRFFTPKQHLMNWSRSLDLHQGRWDMSPTS